MKIIRKLLAKIKRLSPGKMLPDTFILLLSDPEDVERHPPFGLVPITATGLGDYAAYEEGFKNETGEIIYNIFKLKSHLEE